jgi:uncharacterized membrane protein
VPSPDRVSLVQIISLRTRTENTLSLDLFILGIVSYCLGMSLLTEWMGLSHEVRTRDLVEEVLVPIMVIPCRVCNTS